MNIYHFGPQHEGFFLNVGTDGARIFHGNQEATNGVVHSIDRVLTPGHRPSHLNLYQIAQLVPELSTLVLCINSTWVYGVHACGAAAGEESVGENASHFRLKLLTARCVGVCLVRVCNGSGGSEQRFGGNGSLHDLCAHGHRLR